MIKRYRYNPIIRTGAVVKELACDNGSPAPFALQNQRFLLKMDEHTRIYGLGETVRGITSAGGSTRAGVWTKASTPRKKALCTARIISSS